MTKERRTFSSEFKLQMVRLYKNGKLKNEIIRSQAEAAYLSHHDQLLGLPNRLLLTELARQHLEQARNNSGRAAGALLMIDLDHFKNINESLGHTQGDLLLRHVAERLQALVHDGMTLARMGGDEFALLCENCPAERAASLALILLDSLAQAFHLDDQELFVTASVGIVLYPSDINTVNGTLQSNLSTTFLVNQMFVLCFFNCTFCTKFGTFCTANIDITSTFCRVSDDCDHIIGNFNNATVYCNPVHVIFIIDTFYLYFINC
nr:diguanylate cyclase [Klebsiella pneumoniae]